MYKNQLQELAQRSCFNLPSYVCIREGPDHAPRFKAAVTFNGETFESPKFYTTLRQAEHAAAEVALNTLSRRGPSQSLAARILDETGVCKNLLQEMAQRAGVPLPVYTTTRSGPGHMPVFTCSVEVAGMTFSGEAGKSKKQAEKNAAMVAWSALKQLGSQTSSTSRSSENEGSEEQEQNAIARILAARHREEQGANVSHNHVQRTPSNANKIRVKPHWDGSAQPICDMASPYSARGWVAFEFNGDAIQPQRFVATQQPNPTRCRPFYLPYASHDGQSSVTGCGQSLEIVPSNRMVPSNSRKLVPVQIGNTHLISHSRQDAPVLLDEHQRDEEEWFRSSASSMTYRPGIVGTSMPLRPTSTNTLYNPASWSHSAQWLNMHPTSAVIARPYGAPISLAPPVRVRSAVAVSSAPPRVSRPEERQNESTEEQVATCQVINDIKSLKLE
uniref:DRBM domain-containing protein n=1 Tax=Araucaria cunninghamii TaxID=56994 RepID=A0A0D6R383_ARACU